MPESFDMPIQDLYDGAIKQIPDQIQQQDEDSYLLKMRLLL